MRVGPQRKLNTDDWCFWTVVLEKTLERVPWTARRSNQSILKEIHLEYSLEGLMAEAEIPILWPLDAKTWLISKDPDAGNDWRQEKGMTEGEVVGWHHWLNGHEFEQAPGVGDGQGSLACCMQFMGLQRVGRDRATELNWATKILQEVLAAKKENIETVLNKCTKTGWAFWHHLLISLA